MENGTSKLQELLTKRHRIEQRIAALSASKPTFPSVQLTNGYASVDEYGNVEIANHPSDVRVCISPADATALAAFIREWLGD